MKNPLLSPLRSRWQTPEGQVQVGNIIKALQKGWDIDRLGFVQRYEGRWDLRGFALPPVKVKDTFPFRSYLIQLTEGKISFTRSHLMDIDFSFANLTDSMWTRCSFENVLVDGASANHLGFWACKLKRISFRNADLRYSGFGGCISRDTNEFDDVDFSETDLRGTAHSIECYRNCNFSNARLKDINFEGARFHNCQFVGLLDDVIFRTHCLTAPPAVLPWEKVDTRQFANRMENVDFSAAVLRGVDFDGVDLSTCALPQDKYHLIVHNPRQLYLKARAVVSKEWPGEDRRKALFVLERIYLKESKRNQPIDVVNKQDDVDIIGPEFGEKFFSLLQHLCREIDDCNPKVSMPTGGS